MSNKDVECTECAPDQDMLSQGKNKLTVVCQRCGSIILRPGMGNFEENEYLIPCVTAKAKVTSTLKVDKLKNFWRVDDIYTFENVAFSNTVDDMKYLICADCEIGPIGWHSISSKKSYVALSRVLHK